MEELYRQYSQIVFHFLYTRCKDPLLAEEEDNTLKASDDTEATIRLPVKMQSN